MKISQKNITIVCGHYGSGKTNLSVNLAMDAARNGQKVTLVDLDLVNPYFCSSEYSEILEKNGVRVISPLYAGTNLDIPAIPPEISEIFDDDGSVILDVGGDDAGATVLGRLAAKLETTGYEMLYVINRYRALAAEPETAAELLREIERASRLKATAVVNNSHLKQLTCPEDVLNSLEFARETAERLSLPLKFTTAPKWLAEKLSGIDRLYPVEIYVRTPWEIDEKGGV